MSEAGMDITQALRDTENALRDFIAAVMQAKYGSAWPDHTGLSAERIARWKSRKAEEEQRLGSASDERLIYFADFYDIKTILDKNWNGVPEFSRALGEKKELMVWLDALEDFRNPDAHRRELLPHQKQLALGIEGEIRTRLIKYRNKQEAGEDYYPRIEFARDSLGNSMTPTFSNQKLNTKMRLRPGDKLEFVVTARDPLGDKLEYGIKQGRHNRVEWQNDNSFSVTIYEDDVGAIFVIALFVVSSRKFHQYRTYDYSVRFTYEVLPPRA
jgi:HEPN superfamily Swt1-like protein